ncbi:MAG TPA: hypothetical protein VLH86_04105 [Patescibacteria group bacterium]|nr:hypothetical protein [Patescibacteria group bacterium]
MNKTLRLGIIYALILAPVWVTLIASHFVLMMSQGDPVLLFIETLGVAVIGILGVIFSALVRKKPSADIISVLGYAVLAVVVCCFVLSAARHY